MIRKKISKILGYTITDDGYEKAFDTLEKEGRITIKHIIQILLILIQKEEEREKE